MSTKENQRVLPFTCPICGRVTDRPLEELKEGVLMVCPFCNLRLVLHGHMWEEVKQQIAKMPAPDLL